MKHTSRVLLLSCLTVAAVALPHAPASAKRACFGKDATIVGTAGPDRLVGTGRADVIWAGDGDDRIRGRGGKDLICGAEGDDVIGGGRGDDAMGGETLVGGAGDDRLFAAPGPVPSRLAGGPGDDWIQGVVVEPATDEYYSECAEYGWCYYEEPDAPHIVGTVDYSSSPNPVEVNLEHGLATGQGRDTLVDIRDVIGSDGRDVLEGSKDNNVLIGGGGNDLIDGRAGSDLLVGQQGDDAIDGASGVDGVVFMDLRFALEIDLEIGFATGDGSDAIAEIEDVFASVAAGSRIVGTSFANQIHIGGGSTLILSGAGDDKISTNAGSGARDEIDAGFGDDYVATGAGDDALAGGPGNDELHAGTGTDSTDGGPGYDVCTESETPANCES